MTLVGKEMTHLDNSSLQFTTFNWKDFAARTHVESIHILDMITDPNQKELFEATPKLAQYWRSKTRDTLTVMELKLRSVLCKKKGTQSWIVISRSVSKYMTELLEEHRPSWIPWKQSWTSFSRKIWTSEKINWDSGWNRQKRSGKAECWLLLMKLADSLNPRKCSSIWQTNGLIRLKGKRAGYLWNKIREIELLRKIARNIATKCGTTKNLLCGDG